MMAVEQTQDYRTSFAFTKPNQSNLCWSHADHQLSPSTQALILSLGVTSVANSQSDAEKAKYKN